MVLMTRLKMKELERKSSQLHGLYGIPLVELLTPAFIAACSDFESVHEMLKASGVTIFPLSDIEAIPADDWDTFIRNNTVYSDWSAMLVAAVNHWTVRRLGF